MQIVVRRMPFESYLCTYKLAYRSHRVALTHCAHSMYSYNFGIIMMKAQQEKKIFWRKTREKKNFSRNDFHSSHYTFFSLSLSYNFSVYTFILDFTPDIYWNCWWCPTVFFYPPTDKFMNDFVNLRVEEGSIVHVKAGSWLRNQNQLSHRSISDTWILCCM